MKIQVCAGKSCSGKYSKYIISRIHNDIQFYNMKSVDVSECCCMGQCKKGINMTIGSQKHNYMNPAKASQLIQKEYKTGKSTTPLQDK